jgi:hypothetical protein
MTVRLASRWVAASALTSRQANSRADPSAVWYRAVRLRPRLYIPSATFSTELLAARRICRARSASLRSSCASAGRRRVSVSSITR